MFHQPSTFGDGLAVDPEWFRASEDPVIRLELIARMLLKLGPYPNDEVEVRTWIRAPQR